VFCTDIKAIDEAEVIMRKVLPNAEFRRMHSLMGVEAEKARKWFEGTDEGWLFAVNMISEGAHYKGVNTIVMFRRTESSLVFNQQLGRIITLARDEDPEAIVFDLVNNANNIQDSGKRFAGSLRAAYQKRKENGGKKKSEQVIVEDYAEKISEILVKIISNHRTAKQAVMCLNTKQIFSSFSNI
jgi:superfamily II DNA or RNA helicase